MKPMPSAFQRFNISAFQKSAGGALMILVLICALMGTLMVSYLSLIQSQHLSVARAQAWNSAVVVAEAGIEEGMALLNSGVPSSGWATHSWASLSGSNWRKTNSLGTA